MYTDICLKKKELVDVLMRNSKRAKRRYENVRLYGKKGIFRRFYRDIKIPIVTTLLMTEKVDISCTDTILA